MISSPLRHLRSGILRRTQECVYQNILPLPHFFPDADDPTIPFSNCCKDRIGDITFHSHQQACLTHTPSDADVSNSAFRSCQFQKPLLDAIRPSEFADHLQEMYDCILRCDHGFPYHIRRMHRIALEVRDAQHNHGVDQRCLLPGKNSLLRAKKVVYVVFSRKSYFLTVFATRNTAMNHFLTDVCRIGASAKLRSHRWIEAEMLENLGLYILESLRSDHLLYSDIASMRKRYWDSTLVSQSLVWNIPSRVH